jgi:uncharacterized membrane protein
MRRAVIWAVVGAAVSAGVWFAFGTATAARVYRDSPGDSTAATVAVGAVLAIFGAMAGAFTGAVAAVSKLVYSKPSPGPEEDYADPPVRPLRSH